MGEVEAVFGIWLIPLFVAITAFHGWATMVEYVGNVNVADAIFVVLIMAMASSLPIIRFTETVIAKVSAVGKGTPASWWLAILTLGPLLSSTNRWNRSRQARIRNPWEAGSQTRMILSAWTSSKRIGP
jgi:hypothetical protein